MDQVRLPDLEVIRRYSIAVRREHAPAEEVIDALQSDIDAIKRALRSSSQGGPAPARTSSPRPAARKRPASKSRSRSTRRG